MSAENKEKLNEIIGKMQDLQEKITDIAMVAEGKSIARAEKVIEKTDALEAKAEAAVIEADKKVDAAEAKAAERKQEVIDKIDAKDAEINSKLDAFDNKVEEQLDKFDAKIDEQLDKFDAKAEEFSGKVQDHFEGIQKDIAYAKSLAEENISEEKKNIQGVIEAIKENIRITAERRNSRAYSALLKAQMALEEGKAKVEHKKDNVDAKLLEIYIADSLDYAEACIELSNYAAEEALLACLDAKDALEELEAIKNKYAEE